MTLYDISTATQTDSLDLTQGGFPPFLCWGVFWRDDGLKLYTINGSGSPRHILEWDVPTPYDLSTAVFLQQLTLSGGQFPIALRFKPDGTKMYAIDSWFSIIQWDLSTPWDVTTAVDSGGFVLNRDNENNDFFITEDGEKLFVLGSGASLDGADDRIYELDLIDPFDIDTAVYVTRPNPSRHITENEPEGFDMKPDGTRMWVSGTVSQEGIYQYNLSPPFDIFSGGNPNISFSTELIENNPDPPQSPWGLRFSGNPKGSKAYFTSGWYPFTSSPNTLYELSMPFTQTTRDTGDALVVDALIIAQGSVIGNCEDEQFRLWRSNRAGGNINDDHQTGSYQLRPLHGPSSTPLVLGKEVTGIKVTKGIGGTSKFTLAIYSGPGLGFPNCIGAGCSSPLNTILRSFTDEVDFTGTGDNEELIVPLLFPYFIDSTDHDDIQVCIAVKDEVQPGHNRVTPAQSWRADDNNTSRKQITFGAPASDTEYPFFPSDFLLNESDGSDEAKFFELVTREEAKQKECFDIGARVIQKQTKITDPDQFKMGATLFLPKFTTGFPAFPSVRLKGTSGISGGIPPVEPKINAILKATVGMGGIGNEPKMDALLSIAPPADGVTKFIGTNSLLKRLGENGSCTFFSDDFSSYTSQAEADLAWAFTNPGGSFFIRVNIENDNIDFNFNPIFFNGDNRAISHDLGAGVVPDDKWKLNAKINFTTFDSNFHAKIYFGLSDMDHNTSINGRVPPFDADRIMIRLVRNGAFPPFDFSFKAIDTNDTFEGVADDEVAFDFQTDVDYFLTVQRDSVTTYHVEVFTDEARTISLGRANGTCPSDLKDLRYIIIQNFNDTVNFTVQGTIDDIFFTAESGSVGCFNIDACLTLDQQKNFTVNAIVANLALDLTWQYREHKTSALFNPNMSWLDANRLRMFTSTGSIGAAHTLKTFRLSEITGSTIKVKWERFFGNTGRGSLTVYDGAISAESLVDIPNAGGIPFTILGNLTGQPSRFPLRTETLDSSEINYAGATGEFLTVVLGHADGSSLTDMTFDIHEVEIGRAIWFFTGGIVITDVRGTQQASGIDDFGYVNASSTAFKNIFEDTFTIGARLVKEETKLKTFEIDAQIVVEDSKIFCIDVILIGTRKEFSIDSTLSIPVGVTPFTNFNIDAVISGITVNFDIDVVIADPFQTLESESVLGVG